MTALDAPLPNVDGQDAPMTIDQLRDHARAVYSNAFNDILDRIMAEFLLPGDQVSILYDVAQFTTFLCASKIVVARMQEPTKSNLLAAYWPMQKALKDDVPDMLRNLAIELAAENQPVGRITDPI